MKKSPRQKPRAEGRVRCAHAAARHLRERVWWCEVCGAIQLGTRAKPEPAEWIAPTGGIGPTWSDGRRLRVDWASPQDAIPEQAPRIAELEHRVMELEIFTRRISHAVARDR